MKKLTEHEFSTQVISEAQETMVPISQVLVNMEPVNSFIVGGVFKSCIRYKDFYIVFMTDDIPCEETLYITFLNRDYGILDSAAFDARYAMGIFNLLDICEPNSILFRYAGETTWKLELSSTKQFTFPFISEPAGVSRKYRFSRYFKISDAHRHVL